MESIIRIILIKGIVVASWKKSVIVMTSWCCVVGHWGVQKRLGSERMGGTRGT